MCQAPGLGPHGSRGVGRPLSSAQGLNVPASSVEVVPCLRPLRAPGRCSSAGRLGSSLGLTWSGPWAERHRNASTPSLSSACLNHSPQDGPQVLLLSARQHPGGTGAPHGLGGWRGDASGNGSGISHLCPLQSPGTWYLRGGSLML